MAYLFLIGLYCILCLLYSFFRHRCNVKERDCDEFFCICFYAACAIIMGFRGLDVGVDTSNYADIFRDISMYPWTMLPSTHSDMEMGYKILMKSCSVVDDNYFFFQIVISCIFCGISGYITYKYSFSPLLASAMFLGSGLFLAAFNITRQMLAVALIALGSFRLFEQKFMSASILFLLSLSVHITSIVVIILIVGAYLIRNKPKLSRMVSVLILCLPFFSVFLLEVFDYLTGNAYANYLSNQKIVMTAGLSKLLWGISAVIAMLILWKSNEGPMAKMIALLSLFYTVANIIGLSINYAERVGLFFLPFVCFCYDLFGKMFKSQRMRTNYNITTCICFLILFYISTLTPQYINYHFFI